MSACYMQRVGRPRLKRKLRLLPARGTHGPTLHVHYHRYIGLLERPREATLVITLRHHYILSYKQITIRPTPSASHTATIIVYHVCGAPLFVRGRGDRSPSRRLGVYLVVYG